MSLRVVCDTNVLVSAFIAGGPPSRVVEEVVAGTIELLLPELVLDELGRVLVEKLGFEPQRVTDVEAFLVGLAAERLPRRSVAAPEVTGDPADAEILALAVDARADLVVTGDRRHLLPVGVHRDVRLLTPQALLAELRAR